MSLGRTPRQPDFFRPNSTTFCEPLMAPNSIYALLHRECFTLFPDTLFADLFTDIGRHSVPPMVVAVVMVLQRLEGLSDREAVERFTFDSRWKYAAGGLDLGFPAFVHTVLVDMRARLARSETPSRIFDVVLEVGRRAGVVGHKRVLDSTPIYDAVATMDTVTLVRSAIRGLLAVAGELTAELRGLLRRDDDYASAGKPACDYDDRAAREALVDALATDAQALLLALDGRQVPANLSQAARLLASIVGQDLEAGQDGVFRIARRVATDRIISTVDPQARHGHKTAARHFDGYKGHIAIDPDSEFITASTVTAGNSGDAAAVVTLLVRELSPGTDTPLPAGEAGVPGCQDAVDPPTQVAGEQGPLEEPLTVYGDAAYGAGEVLQVLDAAKAVNRCKVQPPAAPAGRFSKANFSIDLEAGCVTCPAHHTVSLTPLSEGSIAQFGSLCTGCQLAEQCTTSASGRTVQVGPHEAHLSTARAEQADPAWRADYRAVRPKVERKLAHLMRRRHGGRRARVRGQPKVMADFALLVTATNLARLAVLGLTRASGVWVLQRA
ncbi:MAG: transposase [Chloroflexota bacterium]